MSKRLVTLDQNVPLDVPVDELAVHEPDYKHLIAFLKAMEFTTITRRVAEKSGIDASAVEADATLSRASAAKSTAGPLGAGNSIWSAPPSPARPRKRGREREAPRPAPSPPSRSPPRAAEARAHRQDRPLANTNACARCRA